MFGSLLKAAVGVITLPIDVAVDVVTLGGTLTDGESKVVKKLGTVEENLNNAIEPSEDK